MKDVRMANGRYELTRGFDADLIPAGPGPRPIRTASLPAALPEKRSTQVTSSFSDGELTIFLGFCSPDVERPKLNQLITDAKKKGLRLVTLFIESEVANELSAYVFLKRNKFSRNEGREGGLRGQLVFERTFS